MIIRSFSFFSSLVLSLFLSVVELPEKSIIEMLAKYKRAREIFSSTISRIMNAILGGIPCGACQVEYFGDLKLSYEFSQGF